MFVFFACNFVEAMFLHIKYDKYTYMFNEDSA